jgi:hypothetical protein
MGGDGLSIAPGASTGAVTSVQNNDGTLTVAPPTGAVVTSLANPLPATALAIIGSSTGKTTLTTANASASNYTITLPAVTSTAVVQSNAASSTTGPDAPGASNVTGTSTNYARQDHDHGLPAFKSSWPIYGSNTVTTTLIYFGFGANFGSSTIGASENPFPYAATVKNLYLNVISNTLSGADHYTVTVYVNGSATGITFQVTGGVTGAASDTSHTATITAGQYVTLGIQSNAGTGAFAFTGSLEFDQT